MKADIKYLDNPEIYRVNQLPAHSDHAFYNSREEMNTGQNSLQQKLGGIWKFKFSKNAGERPVEFYQEDFNIEDFDDMQVPGHIELAGYDKIQYINTMYPWEGHIYRRPVFSLNENKTDKGMFSEASYNPVGSYIKKFDLEENLLGKRICICFEGVEQAMYVWLNGEFVGYAEDSFTPSEFDLTPYIREKGNLLAVEVHKRSTAAFLEDQDFFRFFGIFRDVTVYAKPDIHIEDIWVKAKLDEDNSTGSLALDIKTSYVGRSGYLNVILKDNEGNICLEKTAEIGHEMHMKPEKIKNVAAWDYNNPYLYLLTIEVFDHNGDLVEIVPYKIGFRRVEIKDKIILLNGKRLIINGVNRHEWNPKTGRCISMEDMKYDIEAMRKNNINAVRTSHYPNQIPWYFMCDENGVYMMAETNLESHGSWQKMGAVEPSWNVPGSIPQWGNAVLDRAKTNFETFKNHVSILFWSLGNESYAGDNIEKMNRFFEEQEDGRLIHYEGIYHNRKYNDTISDVESRMYATPQEIREYLDQEPEKPFILCEYMHCMGNSAGGLKSYINLIEAYDMYQGGFLWDFIDQALYARDEVTGESVLCYGGDYDDRPSDYEFSGNGLLFADRTEKPAMQEVKYYYGLYK